jgi:SAM-dependent methyltransferase
MLNKEFWDTRYKNGETGWDLGLVSPPLKEYIDQLDNLDLRILIPGGGNSYEAEYLLQKGFTQITVLDISEIIVKKLKLKFESKPQIKIVCGDYFEQQGIYDLILEQTFFCAIDPKMRKKYFEKAWSLLSEKGKIAGVYFNSEFSNPGPPFGGSKQEYETYLKPYFSIHTLSLCNNSVVPRMGNELFGIFKKSA